MDLILNGSTYVQFAFGFLILWISFVLTRREKHLNLNEPPLVPYKYPIIGHTIDYLKDNENFINKCREEYGEIFSLYVFGRIITVVGEELSPEVFKNSKDFNHMDVQLERFPVDTFLRRPRVFFEILGEIIQRNLPGELKFYMERFQRHLPKTIDEIIGDGKVLQPPIKYFRIIAAKLSATFIVGDLSDDEEQELINLMIDIVDDISSLLSIPPILSFVHPTLHKYFLIILFRTSNRFKASKPIKQKIILVAEKRLQEMKNQGDTYNPPVDMLQRFIEIFRDDYDAITDLVVATIFATVHSTSKFMTHSLQEFANHPEFHEELLKEQEQLNKIDGNSLKEIAKMEKLDSLVREALRIYAETVGLPHKVISSHFSFSNGYQVPKDRFVYLHLREIHSNEKSCGLNPNEFNAFRHLKIPASHVDKNFLAFGSGKHTCPGRTFAINGIKVILHHLLLRYNIKNVGNEIVKPTVIGAFKFPSDAGMIFEKRKIN